MADIGASVLARLRNKAKETGRSNQLCMQLFCQEEFLAELFISAVGIKEFTEKWSAAYGMCMRWEKL